MVPPRCIPAVAAALLAVAAATAAFGDGGRTGPSGALVPADLGAGAAPAEREPAGERIRPTPRQGPAGDAPQGMRIGSDVEAFVPNPAGALATALDQEVDPGIDRSLLHLPRAREPIKPIPENAGADPERAALGRALFHDPRLSRDGTVSCATCHDLANGGDDGKMVSEGVGGQPGPINSPTVFNVGLNFKQFWDGRADTLEEQIDGPVQSPVEMASLWPEVITKLHADESYAKRFKALYPDGINRGNVKDALAEFMKSLTTPNSRFDRWLKGDDGALNPEEERGYILFKLYGCVSCHQGANVGGNMFQVFGVLNDYFERRGGVTDADLGRYNVTGEPADRHVFKVPSLRLAALTAPYLHDGSAATLRDAVDAMFEFQLGRPAPDAHKKAIVAFIRTLPGEHEELGRQVSARLGDP